MEEALQRAEDLAQTKFHDICLGDGERRAPYLEELSDGMQGRAERLRKENEEVASSTNENFLLQRWDAEVVPLLRPYRQEHDAAGVPEVRCAEAEASLREKVEALRREYETRAVGSAPAQIG